MLFYLHIKHEQIFKIQIHAIQICLSSDGIYKKAIFEVVNSRKLYSFK